MARASVRSKTTTEPTGQRVIGQSGLRHKLAEILRDGRAAHAFLFSGPRGIGKAAIALELAELILCDEKGLEPCGQCPQCTLLRRLLHPDLHLVFPLPGKKGVEPEKELDHYSGEIAALTAALAADRYGSTILRKSREKSAKNEHRQGDERILTDHIRQVLRIMQSQPYQATSQVTIIFHADTMTDNAQGALLKTLEEPPPDGYLILVTEHEGDLLPTICSRCQRIRVPLVPPEDIAAGLVATGVEVEAAETAANISGGSFSRAREVAGSGLHELQEHVLDFLRTSALCDPRKIVESAEAVLDTGSLPADTGMELLEHFLHDVALHVASSGGATPPLTFPRHSDTIHRLVASYPQANIETALNAVEEASRYLSKGYTRELVMISLAIRLSRALGPRQR